MSGFFECGQNAVPSAAVQMVRQQAQAVLIIKKHGGQCAVSRRVLRCNPLRRTDQFECALCPGGSGFEQRLPPGSFLGRDIAVPHGRELLQRSRRVRQGLREIVELLDRAAGRIIGAAAVIQIGKSAEIRVSISLFEHRRERFLPQPGKGSIIGHRKVRRNIQR